MPQTTVLESYGDQIWTKRRADDIDAAETITDPIAMPDHAFLVTRGAAGMEIKADFSAATGSVTLALMRLIGPNSEPDFIESVTLTAHANKVQVAAGELLDKFATAESRYVDIKGSYKLALIVTAVTGTVNSVYTRFLN